jgi:hypothetical protein
VCARAQYWTEKFNIVSPLTEFRSLIDLKFHRYRRRSVYETRKSFTQQNISGKVSVFAQTESKPTLRSFSCVLASLINQVDWAVG